MARLLTRLEDANCPDVYLSAIRNQFNLLKNDLCEANDYERYNR
jgi:hypothetical protein